MPERPILMHPQAWRRYMRDWAEVTGLSRAEMRAEMRAAGHDLCYVDPWRVPLTVIQPEAHQRAAVEAVAAFEGVLFGVDATGTDRLGGGWR
ncbi:MAG: hypothetical protein RLP09_09650 [Sandaracinaceae bacterium]